MFDRRKSYLLTHALFSPSQKDEPSLQRTQPKPVFQAKPLFETMDSNINFFSLMLVAGYPLFADSSKEALKHINL
jgi:hypothetical protein